MAEKTIHGIAQRVDEMRDTFQYGKKILNFLDELFHIYQDIVPLLEKINKSIEESSSNLPHASNELSKVTQATEVATIEILNTIEEMNCIINESSQLITKVSEKKARRKKLLDEVLKLCKSLKSSNKGKLAESAESLVKQIIADESEEDLVKKVTGNTEKLSEYASDITISLQVQDITAQQLAAVNQLVESVHNRLHDLLQSLDENNVAPPPELISGKAQSFDPDATYFDSKNRQKFADSVQNSYQNESRDCENHKVINNKPSQEEIDRLFNNNG